MVKKLKDNNENKDKPRKDFTYEAPKEDPYKIYGECFTKSTESFGNGKYYSIDSIIEEKGKDEIKYHLGVDSLNIKNFSVFITSLVGVYPDKSGAFVFFKKQKC